MSEPLPAKEYFKRRKGRWDGKIPSIMDNYAKYYHRAKQPGLIKMIKRQKDVHFEYCEPENLHKLIQKACIIFDITKEDFFSQSRKREFVECRHVITWHLRKNLYWPYQKISKFFGKKNHTTFIKNMRRAKALLDTDPDFRFMFSRILSEL